MVQINVTDVNDNFPIFPPGVYMANISEHAPVGLEVITVVATDRDLDVHMEISYAIQNENIPFQIADPSVSVCLRVCVCVRVRVRVRVCVCMCT